jgi:hypothetical protein
VAVDTPLTAPDALIRPWRTATLVASLVAAVELVVLLILGFVLLAKPLAKAVERQAASSATAAASVKKTSVHHAALIKPVKVGLPKLARRQTRVFVLNGNGRAGAAHAEAAQLQHLGYRVPGATNAKRSDYATTVIMFRPGYHPEANRLARDLHVRIVGALDGMKPAALHGAQLAIILGAR